MDYKLTELIDIPLLQNLQEKLNIVYSFPSAIIDNDGNILTAVAWQDVCTKFHRRHPQCEKECIKSDQYILEHLHEANPAVSYRCPHGLIDNAIPIMIDGKHLGNFFTGQFFLEKPDMAFFKNQAGIYGFDEKAYLDAVECVPIWTKEKLTQYLDFIRDFIEIIAGIGLTQLKQIEANKVIKESAERNKAIVQSTYDWIWEIDKNGKYCYSSDKVERILGYTAAEIIGKTPFDLMPKEECERVGTIFQNIAAKKGSIVDLENWNIHKDGHKVCLLTNGFPIISETGEIIGYRGADKDISERKRIELNLHESEERFNLAMKASNDGLFDWNLETNAIYYSPAWKKMLGYEDHELPNDFSIWENLTEPGDVIKSWNLQRKLISGELDRFVLEFKMKHKEGHWIDILAKAEAIFNRNGKAVRIVGTHTDITRRKQSDEELRIKGEIVENMAEGVLLVQTKDGTIVYANATIERMFGAKSGELIGKNIQELNAPTEKSPEQTAQEIQQSLYETGIWQGEVLNIKLDGTPFWSSAKVSTFNHFQLGDVWVGIHEDITIRKQIEDELIKAKEQAEESDRLKSAFLANMSHEIRTPMNGILGFAELLKEPGLTGAEQLEYIRIIEKSGARMLNIINDIIDISKIESGLIKLEMEVSNINEQIEYIYTFFKPEVEAKGMKLSIRNTLPSSEAIIYTDREKLYAILTNLVKNAIKYTNEGSIEFGYYLVETFHGTSLQFFVKDTGIGIPKDRLEAIFERFIQADMVNVKARQGAGLGLAITKSYVEILGGKIWAESGDHGGSTFYFTLPYSINPIDNQLNNKPLLVQKKESQINVEGRDLKILIVEDDTPSVMLLSLIIKLLGRNILKARNGLEAVEICRNNPDIDLILMDIQMPLMGGYEATRLIREFNKDVVIIAQTAYGLAGEMEKAIKAGCNDYISKPIDKNLLLEVILKHLTDTEENKIIAANN